MINNRLKGYTIIELLIAMLLLVILVGMGLQVTQLIRFNFDWLDKKNSELIDIRMNDMEISSEFLNSNEIMLYENPILFQFNEDKRIAVGEEIISASSDKVYFDSIFDVKILFLKNQFGKKMVSCLMFSILNQGVIYPFTYYKNYDVATKLKFEQIDSISF